MNQLPEIFPIRYAIIAETNDDEEYDDRPLQPDPKVEMIFRQYVLQLQKEPITKKNIRTGASYLKATFSDIDIAYIAKLGGDYKWISKSTKALINILPGIEVRQTGQGSFINTSLYSYRGAFEIPFFVKASKEFKKTENRIDFRNKFGIDSSMFGYFYKRYQMILDNKLSSWELYQILSPYRQPIRITIPYSSIWKFLDSGKNNGFLSKNIHQLSRKNELLSLPDETNNHSNKKIEVVICRNWDELFAEELSVFYKMLTRCKNCNKPLPFNYKGNYCPTLPENNHCVKERNRKRKSQVSK